MNKYKNLNAWKAAKNLAILVYQITDSHPKKEIYTLTSQTTRAAVSIPANIAEGDSRKSGKDFCHFLDIAIGSLFELETLLEIAFSRNYFDMVQKDHLDVELENTVKLIYGLKRSINSKLLALNSQL